MKHAILISAIATLACLPACDKVRQLSEQLKKSVESPPTTTATPPPPNTGGAVVSQLTVDNFDSFTNQSDRVVMVDFYADWCGPCRQLAPVLEKLTNESGGKVALGKVNVDEAGALATKHVVRSIPDVRIFANGRQVDRFVGVLPESEIRTKLEPHLKELTQPQLAPPPVETTPTPPTKEKEPLTQPMSKDWLPPGMQRR